MLSCWLVYLVFEPLVLSPRRSLAGIDDSPFSQHRVDYEVLKHALTIISPILELLNNGQSGRSHLSHLILVPQDLLKVKKWSI